MTELAIGALTGWPYALAMADRERATRLGIRSIPRLRQWHLDRYRAAVGGSFASVSFGFTSLAGLAARRLRRVE